MTPKKMLFGKVVLSLIGLLVLLASGCLERDVSIKSVQSDSTLDRSVSDVPRISSFSPTPSGFWFIKNSKLFFFNLKDNLTIEKQPADSAYFRDTSLGWYSDKSGLWSSRDGGVRWDRISVYENDKVDSMSGGTPLFSTARVGSLRTGSEIWLTVDAGRNWSLVYPTRDFSSDTLNAYPKQVYFFDESVMWLLMTNGRILRRAVDGKTWLNVSSAVKGDLLTIHCFEKNDCLIGMNTGSGMYRSSDGGKSWSKVKTTMPASNILSVSFGSSAQGLAIEERIADSPYDERKTDDNLLIRSADGGRTWHSVTFVAEPLEEVHFVDDTTAWILGRNSVYLSEDGGNTWKKIIDIDGL